MAVNQECISGASQSTTSSGHSRGPHELEDQSPSCRVRIRRSCRIGWHVSPVASNRLGLPHVLPGSRLDSYDGRSARFTNGVFDGSGFDAFLEAHAEFEHAGSAFSISDSIQSPLLGVPTEHEIRRVNEKDGFGRLHINLLARPACRGVTLQIQPGPSTGQRNGTRCRLPRNSRS